MTITPDDKDWTWVLDQACGECGFDSTSVAPVDVPGLLRANAERWRRLLDQPAAELRARPAPEVWSPLEYACHVRDTCHKFHIRLGLMLAESDPLFENWDQDATAIEERYAEQDPATVKAELGEAAEALASAFEGVGAADDERWQRPGRRSDGSRFTAATLSRYLVHDPIHHIYDVTGVRYAAGA